MTTSGIPSAILIGAILGILGRLVAPGRQPIGFLLTIAVGIGAALLGTFLVGPLRETSGVDWTELVVQVVLAAVGVSIAAGATAAARRP